MSAPVCPCEGRSDTTPDYRCGVCVALGKILDDSLREDFSRPFPTLEELSRNRPQVSLAVAQAYNTAQFIRNKANRKPRQ